MSDQSALLSYSAIEALFAALPSFDTSWRDGRVYAVSSSSNHGSLSERGVKQELFAHFTLIAMTRLFTNHSEGSFRSEVGQPPLQANFQNTLRTMVRNVARLRLQYSTTLSKTVGSMLASIANCRQRQRPGRSYPRKSRKPASKWRPSSKSPKTKEATQAA